MLQSLVQRADRVILSLQLAVEVLRHKLCIALQSVVLGLKLDELALELLNLVRACPRERLRQVSLAADAVVLESRAKRRMGADPLGYLVDHVSLCTSLLTALLELTSDHLSQVTDRLREVSSILDLVLNLRK